jgi:hypothetical protein
MEQYNINLEGWETKGTVVSPELLFRVLDRDTAKAYYKLVYFLNNSMEIWLPCSEAYFNENRGIYLNGEKIDEDFFVHYYMPTLGE